MSHHFQKVMRNHNRNQVHTLLGDRDSIPLLASLLLSSSFATETISASIGVNGLTSSSSTALLVAPNPAGLSRIGGGAKTEETGGSTALVDPLAVTGSGIVLRIKRVDASAAEYP